MNKYLAVARITLANILMYRWEFLINQLRTLLLLITLYFLWSEVFNIKASLFGFSREEIITYVFMAVITRQLVMTSATDQIAGELQTWGKFFSHLLRPIGYFRYWFTVDIVYKLTNLILALAIVVLFINFFDIRFILPDRLLPILFFTVSLALAILLYFYIGILVSTTGFWTNQVWGLQFLVVLILEFSAGAYFPIDVLPDNLESIIQLTPFPYLLYYPLTIFLGKLSLVETGRVLATGTLWLILIYGLTRKVWQRGLKVYEAWGT